MSDSIRHQDAAGNAGFPLGASAVDCLTCVPEDSA